jgi:hypothetical protein
MAYLNAAIIAAASQPRTFDAVYDAGMPAFKNVPQNERYAVIDAYTQPAPWYEDARATYVQRMAQTIGLVCTAAEARPSGNVDPNLLVGPGLAARGVAAVVRHELTSRIGILEARFGESERWAHNRFMTGVYKNGPAEAIAKASGLKVRPQEVSDLAWDLTGDLAAKAGIQLQGMVQDGATVDEAALTVIEGIVPVQTDIERAVYTELSVARPPQGE